MENRVVALALAAGSWLCAGPALHAQTHPAPTHSEAAVTQQASGTFEVKMTPQAMEEHAEAGVLGRMSLDKLFHGGLEATSRGEMLSAGTRVEGSAGYVAMERVSGTLGGRTGTFVLQHSGTLTRGAPQLTIGVVPDSGTGGLVGLAGTMTIDIAGGTHSYRLDYTLPVP